MSSIKQIQSIVDACIGRLNAQLATENQLGTDDSVILLGQGGNLDSLSVVNLMLDIEQSLASELGINTDLLETSLTSPEHLGIRSQLEQFILTKAGA